MFLNGHKFKTITQEDFCGPTVMQKFPVVSANWFTSVNFEKQFREWLEAWNDQHTPNTV